ncbi:MAG TPA: serine/threonine-protein kinase, partial [Polyangia bacterium]|nr:serine/threonine-protein kinase [Polyangia bacterium]
GRILGGRLRIIEHLGSGGTAGYYRADHLRLGRPCVLALACPEISSDPLLHRRFLAPARLRAMVSHPNVLANYEVGDGADGRAWYAGEIFDGDPLSEILEEREGRLPLAEALTLARRMAAGLDAVHAAGIVHRNVSPLWFTVGRGEDPVVKLEIGAEAIGPGGLSGIDSTDRFIVGTPAFLSPEEVSGEPGDRRSDLYSFGLTLYRMLTGRVPQYHETIAKTFFGRLHNPLPRLRDLAPDLRVPDGVERALATLVDRSPARRPPTAAAAVDAMIRFSGGTGGRRK